jgi:hypothetical protein
LVVHLTFDEGEGTVARDCSGNGNHGTIRGGRWAKGRINGAMGTFGQNDYIEVARSPSIEPGSAISVALWVNVSGVSYNGFADLVRKSGHRTGGYNFRWSHANGRLRWAPRAGILRVDDAVPNSTYHNAWHHFCGTYDGRTGTARLYIDGRAKHMLKREPVGLTHSGNLYLMGTGGPGQATVLGLIDDFRIYNRVIGDREVRALAAPAR